MTDKVSLLIGGDICPIGVAIESFVKGDAQSIFRDLLPEFERADFSIVNLECPLIEEASPIVKSGPVFGIPVSCIKGLVNSHIDAVNLANNHILDHGGKGVLSTLEACEAAEMLHVGAGKNLKQAGRLLVRDIRGTKVAFAGMAEHEFSIAGEDSPGANPIDPIEFCRTVRMRDKEYDYLVVLLHAGYQHYAYPSPGLQKLCRFMVEEGANAVICQHSHCPGCYEIYRGAPVVYGQGNLIDESPSHSMSWHTGFLVKLSLEHHAAAIQMEIVPYLQSWQQSGAHRMHPREEIAFREELESRSQEILEEKQVEKLWNEFCLLQKSRYLSDLHGHGRFLRGLN
ncbi:hypothetical protein LCGC14_2967500, partial [marine sediment metagenome]